MNHETITIITNFLIIYVSCCLIEMIVKTKSFEKFNIIYFHGVKYQKVRFHE